MPLPRTLLVGLASCALIAAPAAAHAAQDTRVQTERIQLDPPEMPGGAGGIPVDPDLAASPDGAADVPSEAVRPAPGPAPDIRYGEAGLPKPVARTRAQLLEAAHAGDFDRLRMVLEGNEMMPTLTFGEMGDPIETLRAAAGDDDGYEILAILIEVLEAGYVHADVGTAQEMYIWPYFARTPLDTLTAEQKVELYQLVTAGDMAEMDITGTWTFYRVGIGPDGTLHYFVAGD